jgi:DNA-binding response OmpR family regulator
MGKGARVMAGFELIRRFFGNEPGDRRAVPRSGVPKGAWVLVVDDSATIRAVLGKMLSQDGHVVLKAPDGETAIEMARKEKPDLIFLDIVMPGMNGFAVLRALRRDPQTHDIPIVMISGNLQATEQFYVQRFGADDFMKKPFGRGEVFARVQHLTQSGRLVLRERTAEDVAPAAPEHTEAEHAAIPDIAMPDPLDLPLDLAASPVEPS